jgi:O-antigen/teichoic acid export membrane protein
VVFSADVIVVGIVLGASATGSYGVAAKLFALVFGIGTAATSLLFPAFAELEGAGAMARQRSLLVSGLRIGTAFMLLLALPLVLVPDLLIRAWIGAGYRASYSVMAILALVLLIHQPIYVLTQFLIARARQRSVAIVSLAATIANLALSFLLAWTWGTWGVAASTLFTDLVVFAYIVPRIAAPASGASTATLLRAISRPVLPALAVAAVVLVALARVWKPETLLTVAVLGAIWVVPAALAIWRFGFDDQQRSGLRRELTQRPRGAAAVVDA